MASPGELVRRVSELLGIPEPTIIQHDRCLVVAGLRSNLMGRIMTWHRKLSERAAAEIATRHLPNDRRSVIDRVRKRFAQDRDDWLGAGKATAIIHLIEAAGRLTGSSDESNSRGDDKGPPVAFLLPDDDTLEAIFQNLRSKLRAVCTLADDEAFVAIPKLGEIRPGLNPNWRGSSLNNPQARPHIPGYIDREYSSEINRTRLDAEIARPGPEGAARALKRRSVSLAPSIWKGL